MKKVGLAVLVVAVLSLVSLGLYWAWSGPGGGGSRQDALTLAENPVPVSALTILARVNGYFERHNLRVTTKSFPSGKLALDSVIGGSADVATVAEVPLMKAAIVAAPVKVVTMMEVSDRDVKLVVKSDIGSVTALQGKRVATLVGTSAEYFLWKVLEKANLKAGDVQITNIPPGDMPIAFSRGDVDAVAIWEPHALNAVKARNDSKTLDTRDVYYETFNIAVSTKTLSERPATVERFLMALRDASDFIRTNREDAIKIVAKETGMAPEVLAQIWEDFQFDLTLQAKLVEIMRSQADWAMEAGHIPRTSQLPDFRRIVDERPLLKVKPDGVKLP